MSSKKSVYSRANTINRIMQIAAVLPLNHPIIPLPFIKIHDDRFKYLYISNINDMH